MKIVTAQTVSLTEIEAVEDAVKNLNPDSEMTQAIKEMADLARRGETIQVLSQSEELSPNEAAKILNVSRPTVLKMVQRGELTARIVGSRDTRISAESIISLKKRQAHAARNVAAVFANQDDAVSNLIHTVAGVDPETAKRLGY